MSDTMHPAAPHHMPAFITAPGETDVLLTGSVILLIIVVFVLGSLYFWLHSMPERIAHGTSKLQFQLVAVLALLALFTHINAFWVAALLLALVPIPDFWTPLATMAESLAKMAGRRPRVAALEAASVVAPEGVAANSVSLPDEAMRQLRPVESAGNIPPKKGSEAPLAAPPVGADGSGSPVSRTQGSSPPKSRSRDPHRVLSTEGRKP